MCADFADRTDFENANRGLMARLEPGVIKAPDGRVVYDADAFTRTTAGDCPDTVHPSLWRQSQLTAIQGLFEVAEGIYQLRGIELSNMTVVEGDTGVIVIDPAVSAEVSAVRDARSWSRYIAEAIEMFGGGTDVAFASHHWPTWGTDNVRRLMTQQRDLYAYLHDQTLRLLNQGYVGSEIAEMIELPPEAAAARYVKVIGGIDTIIARAREFADAGDLRFAAELASHAVFAAPSCEPAKTLLADVLTRLGYGAECATWRNNFLTRADPADLTVTLTRAQLLAMLGGAGTDGVRFDGDPRVFATIAGLADEPDPTFAIVMP